MSDNTKIHVGADVSEAERNLSKLKRYIEDFDKAGVSNPEDSNLPLQKLQEIEQISTGLTKAIQDYDKSYKKTMDSITKKQQEYSSKLLKATNEKEALRYRNHLNELQDQKKAYETQREYIRKEAEYRKKQSQKALENNGITPVRPNQTQKGGVLQSGLGKALELGSKGSKALGTASQIAGMGSLTGLGSIALGMLSNPAGMVVAAVVGIGMLLKSAYDSLAKPVEDLNTRSYKLYQNSGIFSRKDPYKGTRAIMDTAHKYSYTVEEGMSIAEAVASSQNISSKEQLKNEMEQVMKYAKATGGDAKNIAYSTGRIKTLSNLDTQEVLNLADRGANSLNMEGQSDKVLSVLEQIASGIGETNDTLKKEHLEKYLNFAKSLQDKYGISGEKALNKSKSLLDRAGSNDTVRNVAVAEYMSKGMSWKEAQRYAEQNLEENVTTAMKTLGNERMELLLASSLGYSDADKVVTGTNYGSQIATKDSVDQKFEEYKNSRQNKTDKKKTMGDETKTAVGDSLLGATDMFWGSDDSSDRWYQGGTYSSPWYQRSQSNYGNYGGWYNTRKSPKPIENKVIENKAIDEVEIKIDKGTKGTDLPSKNPKKETITQREAEKAAEELSKKALNSSIGYCAKYVNESMRKHADVSVRGHAADTLNQYKSRGMKEIQDTGEYKNGDIMIFDRKAGANQYGHIQTYYEGNWYSDYKQKNKVPKKYANSKPHLLRAELETAMDTITPKIDTAKTSPTTQKVEVIVKGRVDGITEKNQENFNVALKELVNNKTLVRGY